MLNGQQRDLLGGLLLIAAGVFVAWYASTHYNLGTFRRMGPGMFPMGAGIILAVLGALVLVPAVTRPAALAAQKASYQIWPAFIILVAVAAFGVMVPIFGLIPGVIAVTAISSLAGADWRPGRVAGLVVVLCLMAWLIFRLGLDLPIPSFRWPS